MAKRRGFGAIRRLKSGNYQASYISPDGQRTNGPITYYSRQDAEQWLFTIRKTISAGTWDVEYGKLATVTPLVRHDFKTYLTRYLTLKVNLRGQLLRENTKEFYTRLAKLHLSLFFDLELADITKLDVDVWFADMLRTGKRTTAGHAYKLLSGVMNRAVDDGIIQRSPCRIKGASSSSTGKKVGVATHAEILAISQNIAPRYKYYPILAAYAGLRFSEITELRRKDIIPTIRPGGKAYTIQVVRRVVALKSGYEINEPKSAASKRVIPLPIALTPIVEEMLNALENKNPEALLMPAASGGHLGSGVLAKAWGRAIKKSGLEGRGIVPHSMRHSGGSMFAATGATFPEVQSWLGDSSPSAAQRYIHSLRGPEELVDGMVIDPALAHSSDPGTCFPSGEQRQIEPK